MFYLDLHKEELRFYILFILSSKLTENFFMLSLDEIIDPSKFIGAMLSYTFINSHSQVRDPGSKGPLVITLWSLTPSFMNIHASLHPL